MHAEAVDHETGRAAESGRCAVSLLSIPAASKLNLRGGPAPDRLAGGKSACGPCTSETTIYTKCTTVAPVPSGNELFQWFSLLSSYPCNS